MGRIKLLPENLINRIAAGEVVERPASILKELLENSLDAGATRIDIEVQAGGRKLLRVSDNGCGMDKEELFLCLERHATSKLSANSDLMNISTLGFRGEALPSICAVAKVSITSAQAGNTQGHRIRIEGGKLLGLEPAPANQGTTVEVRDIFFNIPARRKFLKTEATEHGHILDIAQRYALSRTGLRLSLGDGSKLQLFVDEQHDIATRIARIIGRDQALDLRDFEYEKDDLKIKGWLGGPESAGKTSSLLFLYVLGRPVKDRLLTRAVSQGYGRTLPTGRFPTGLIFLELDPARVDVNVHPAKTEVRFREPGQVFDALSMAVADTIGPSPLANRITETQNQFETKYEKAYPDFSFRAVPSPQKISRPVPKTEDLSPPPWLNEPEQKDDSQVISPILAQQQKDTVKSVNPEATLSSNQKNEMLTEQADLDLSPKIPAPTSPEQPRAVKALAQLNQSFVLAQGPEGLYIIDQHAAHERIIYNQLKKNAARDGLPCQLLLFPETLELLPLQALAASELTEVLKHIGFELEPFGGSTFVLKGAPIILGSTDPKPALMEILTAAQGRLKNVEGGGLTQIPEDIANSWLYSLACRAAIKAGQKMNMAEMERLLDDLAVTEAGGYCPHGRPSVIITSYRELEKKFGRI